MALFKPSVATQPPINIDSDIHGNTHQAVSSACEIVAVLATAQGSALFVRLYDTIAEEDIVSERRIAIAANTGESVPFCPVQPMKFTKGVRVRFEQGGAAFGGEIVLVINK